MTAVPEAFGHEVRRRRTEQGVTQVELAKRAGLTEPCIVKTEGGKISPSLSTMTQLAKGLGVSLGDLLPRHAELSPAGLEFARLFDSVEDEKARRGTLTILRALTHTPRKRS